MAPDPQAVKLHTLGNKLAEERKYNEAIAQFEKAIAIQPDYAAAHLHLAEALEAKKLDEKSFESYVRAIELNPNYATQHIDTGLDTLLSGPLGKAVAQYKKQQGADSKPGETIAGPSRSMTFAEQETSQAIRKEKPRGQTGVKPLKILFKPGETTVSTPAGGIDWVTVEVLGAKDIPSAECPVTFMVKNGPEQADAFLGADEAAMSAAEGPKSLKLTTDADGRATIYMKRAKRVGPNTMEVRAEGLSPAIFIDNTHPAGLARVDVVPAESVFSTAQRVSFAFAAFDTYGNSVPDLAFELALRANKRNEWEIIDNATLKTGPDGKATHAFAMPTRGNTKCVLEIYQKQSDFRAEKKFNVVPGTASSMMFIPARKTAAPGQAFTLKLRLMDEYDNPIEGLAAAIVIKESSGGEWRLEDISGETTGEDGSVSARVVAPGVAGATATFAAATDALAPELMVEARAKTDGEAVESEPYAAALEYETSRAAAPDIDMGDDELIPVAGGESLAAPTSAETFLDLDIGSDGLSGLPDMPLDADFGQTPAPAQSDDFQPGGIPGGAAALEGLDFDIDAPSSAVAHESAPLPAETPIETFDDYNEQPSYEEAPIKETTYESDPIAFEPELEPEQRYEGEPMTEIEPEIEQFVSKPAMSDAPDLELHIESAEITCRAGELLPFRVKATDLKGKPLSMGVAILLSIQELDAEDSGAFFMTMSGMQGEKTDEVRPDLAGEAVASIQVPGACGRFAVTASVGEVSKTAIVNVAPGEPSSIVLTAAKTNLNAGEKTLVTAKISDRHGNPTPGEFVSIMLDDYTGTPGTINQGEQMSDENGEVRAVYVAAGAGAATLSASNPSVGSFAVKTATIESIGGTVEQKPAKQAAKPAKREKTEAPPAIEQFDLSEPGGLSEEPAFEPFEFAEPGQAAEMPMETEYEAAPGYEAAAAQGEPGGYEESGSEYGESEESESGEYDDYMKHLEATDPYQPPKFEIKRGRKPVMELNAALPKMIKIGVIVGSILIVALAALFSYKQVLYTYQYSQGRKHYAAGDMENALRFYENAVKINNKEIDPLKRIARIRMDNADKLTQRNQTAQAEREMDLAMKALDQLLLVEPNNLDALYQRGEALESKGEYCAAIEAYEKILKDVDPNYQMAQAKMEQARGLCAQEKQIRGGGARGGVRRSADQ